MIGGYFQAGRFEYACKACGHKAGAKRNLRKHMRSLHPSFLQVPPQHFPIEPNNEKEFFCSTTNVPHANSRPHGKTA